MHHTGACLYFCSLTFFCPVCFSLPLSWKLLILPERSVLIYWSISSCHSLARIPAICHFFTSHNHHHVTAVLSALLGSVSSLHLTGRGNAPFFWPPVHISGWQGFEEKMASPRRRQPDNERSSKPVVNANCAISSELRVDHSPNP